MTGFRLFGRPRERRVVVMDQPTDPRFRIFGGRRHFAALPYPLPKDIGEINRLDFQHFLLRTGFQSNFLAPITRPASILDVGCGSGRWAMEMASIYPEANVIGMDLVPPPTNAAQPLGHGLDRRPDNYAFAAGNVLEGVPFADGNFDFVHQRLLITAIPHERWPRVVAELARVTRPGGWVEVAECGRPVDGGPGLMGLWASWIAFLGKRGVDFTMGHTLGTLLSGAGLANVRVQTRDFPMGAWGGRTGRASATDCLAVGKALRAGVIAAGVLDETEYDRLYTLAERELAQPRGRGVLPFYIAYGQRPA